MGPLSSPAERQMIHAWVFLNRLKDHGPGSNDGHGRVFQAKMEFINSAWHLSDPQVWHCAWQLQWRFCSAGVDAAQPAWAACACFIEPCSGPCRA